MLETLLEIVLGLGWWTFEEDGRDQTKVLGSSFDGEYERKSLLYERYV